MQSDILTLWGNACFFCFFLPVPPSLYSSISIIIHSFLEIHWITWIGVLANIEIWNMPSLLGHTVCYTLYNVHSSNITNWACIIVHICTGSHILSALNKIQYFIANRCMYLYLLPFTSHFEFNTVFPSWYS